MALYRMVQSSAILLRTGNRARLGRSLGETPVSGSLYHFPQLQKGIPALSGVYTYQTILEMSNIPSLL